MRLLRATAICRLMSRTPPPYILRSVALLAVAVGACSPDEPKIDDLIRGTALSDPSLILVVDDYVRQKYGWNKDAYRSRLDGRSRDIVSITLIHVDDLRISKMAQDQRGGGKSIRVEVDVSAQRVLREFGFQ